MTEVANKPEGKAEVVADPRSPYLAKISKIEVPALVQEIAHDINELATHAEGSMRVTRKAYYEAAKRQGIPRTTIETVEQFNENYAMGTHYLASDLALQHFDKNKDDKDSKFKVRAEIGANTVYQDQYSRFDSRYVPTGAGTERRLQETNGYHNPSVKVRYKDFATNRAAVHALANELFK